MGFKAIAVDVDWVTDKASQTIAEAGNTVLQKTGVHGEYYTSVFLTSPPNGLVVNRMMNSSSIVIRHEDEEALTVRYGLIPAAWHEQGWVTPCHCGAAIGWDEAGRVPGARKCLEGHRVQLNEDGTQAFPEETQ